MSLLSVYQAIQTQFKNNWTGTASNRVAYPNVPFTLPGEATEWVRFSILPGDSQQVTLGGSQNIHRWVGVINIGIFTRIGLGEARALELAELAAAIFRAKQLSEIRCFSPSISNLREVDGWYQATLRVPFDVDALYNQPT